MKLGLNKRAQNLILSLVLAVCSSCFEELGCSTEESKPALAMSYEPDEIRLWATVPMQEILLTHNFDPDGYTVSPPMPAGLSFDTHDGSISGTANGPCPDTTFTVRAIRDSHEIAHTQISLTVFEGLAPGSLTYTPSATSAPQSLPIAPMLAQYAGTAESFDVEPPLPSGLSIALENGTISGVCPDAAGVTNYTVTVSNPLGSAQTDIQIEVTAALSINGLIVPSAGDESLDIFVQRGVGFAPIDAESCSGTSPVDVASTPDGKFVFAVMTNGKLFGITRDPSSGFCGAPLELAQTPFARKLAVSPDGLYLLVAADGSMTRFEIQGDGSLCCPSQASGPFAASAILASTSQRLFVGSYPGEIWCYDIAPSFALRGPATDLGPDISVNALVDTAPGARAIAVTTTYDFNTHQLSGAIRDLKLSTDAEIAAGAAAVVQTAIRTHGQDLSDACIEPGSFLTLLVTNRSAGRIDAFNVEHDGTLSLSTPHLDAIGGSPTRILWFPGESGPLVLDASNAEITLYDLTFSTPSTRSKFRTRIAPVAMVALYGPSPRPLADTAFVTSAAESTLLAVRTGLDASGHLIVTAHGPVATGASPRDVVACQTGRFVYTANHDGDSVSAFQFDAATMQLTLIEAEPLQPGSQPMSLAITPGGSHLYVLNATGEVVSMSIDQNDGSLTLSGSATLSGSMAEACLRMDVLARYVFVVQPQLGRVTTMSLSHPFGAPVSTSTLDSLTDPIDLLPSLDGLFVSLLDRELARVIEYRIDGFGGDLLATGATVASGTAPLRLVPERPVRDVTTAHTELLIVVDPPLDTTQWISRNQLTGGLQGINGDQALLANNTNALFAINYSLSSSGLIGTSDDGLDPRISIYSFSGSAHAYVEDESVSIGAGPHALAMTIRTLTP